MVLCGYWKNMDNNHWLITRSRHIPAVYPLLAFFDWKCAEYFDIADSGHVINVWSKGDYFAIWEKQKIDTEFPIHALEKLLGW